MFILLEIALLLCKIALSYAGWIYRLFVARKKKCIKGQVVLITGGGRGIGRELALQFAKEGAKVAICDLDQQCVTETKEDIRSLAGEAYGYKCDITSKADVTKMAARIRADLGEVDILVNNAGIMHVKYILDLSEEEIKRTFDVNVLSHYLTLQEFLPYMISQRRGHVVTTVSASAFQSSPYLTDYAASKYAADGLCESLILDLKEKGITGINVSMVYPFFVSSNMLEKVSHRNKPSVRFGKLVTPREVADAVVDGVLRNNKYIYVPERLRLGRFLVSMLPDKARQQIMGVSKAQFVSVSKEE